MGAGTESPEPVIEHRGAILREPGASLDEVVGCPMNIGRSGGERTLLALVLRDIRIDRWAELTELERSVVEAYVETRVMAEVGRRVGMSRSGVKRVIDRILEAHCDIDPEVVVFVQRDTDTVRLVDTFQASEVGVEIRSQLAKPSTISVVLRKQGGER